MVDIFDFRAVPGRIGRNQASVGTLISPGGTALNTLVQLNPIYVTFNPSETDLVEIQKARAAGRIAEIRWMSNWMPGSPPAWVARLARSSHCPPWSNSPVQTRIPASVAKPARSCGRTRATPRRSRVGMGTLIATGNQRTRGKTHSTKAHLPWSP